MHIIFAQTEPPRIGEYFSLVKVLVVLVLFVGWSYAVQWADRDVYRVNKGKREWWNILLLGGGLGGLAVLILFPWRGAAFFVGLGFWVILGAATLFAYVLHRNSKVPVSHRVLTPAHLKGVFAGKGGKTAKQDKGMRVRMVNFEGKPIEKPDDAPDLEEYDAAQDFLFDMLWKRATDVDVLIGTDTTRVVYKIDGVASEQPNGLAAGEADKVLSFLKKSAGLSTEERRRPQAGKMNVALLGATGKPEPLDVSTSGSTQGERLRLKLNRTRSLMNLDDLGFAPEVLEKYKALVAEPHGLIVFSGPAESGLTTTQYATLRGHDGYLQNLYTLEVQPMMKIENVTQVVYKPSDAEVNFARQLQTVLRREPDVVLISQCEDKETAQLAARAGQEKKIYLTVRAGNALDGLARLMALTEDSPLLAKGLTAVLGQRLVRVLCEACREAYKPDEELLRKANLPVDQIEHFYRPPSNPIVDKRGREIICQTCQNSHYVGRIAAFELLVISDALRKLIAAGASINQIKGQARAEKMRYLQEDGLLKVMAGKTSMAEVMRGLKADGK
jgi:type II secretory ATPase GspE/PulE/Tfp pilus assembly ATPase PilB-like protein